MDVKSFEDLFYKNKKKKIDMTHFNKNFLSMKINDVSKIIDFGSYDKRIFYSKKKKTKSI
jgi:hypothetical protein